MFCASVPKCMGSTVVSGLKVVASSCSRAMLLAVCLVVGACEGL